MDVAEFRLEISGIRSLTVGQLELEPVPPFPHPALTSDLSPPNPPTDLAGCSQDSPDAAARGEGLQQLLVLRDPPDRLRGLRLRQRSAVPVASRHWFHLPDQQQRLPLGALWAHRDETMAWTLVPLPLTPQPPH